MLTPMDQVRSWTAYDRHAARFAAQYETLSFDQVHGPWLHHLPQGGQALDIGAGSGRDAAALARRGFEVRAVEPAGGMRALAMRAHSDPGIRWVDDHLPELAKVGSQTFQLVLLAGIWMHIPQALAAAAFARISDLMASDGVLVMSVRASGIDASRGMREVSATEIAELVRAHGRSEVEVIEASDLLNRTEIQWRTHVIR
jgi:SAM-dependent methyltransferase